jgi:hypothetical protein
MLSNLILGQPTDKDTVVAASSKDRRGYLLILVNPHFTPSPLTVDPGSWSFTRLKYNYFAVQLDIFTSDQGVGNFVRFGSWPRESCRYLIAPVASLAIRTTYERNEKPREMALPEKMKAVVFNGPYSVSVEERPVPHIQDPTDVLVKVKYTALCGR